VNKTAVLSNNKMKGDGCHENETARSNMEVKFKKELIQKVIDKAENEEPKLSPQQELARHFE